MNKRFFLKPLKNLNEWILKHKDNKTAIRWLLYVLTGLLLVLYHTPISNLMRTSFLFIFLIIPIAILIGLLLYFSFDFINTLFFIFFGTVTEPFRIKYYDENEEIEKILVRYKKYKPISDEDDFSAKDILRYLVAYSVILLVFKFFIMIMVIPSSSMESTLCVDDILIGPRYVKEIDRYDIIVFEYPDDPSTLFIKRVIGLPGETVEITNGHVYVNGIIASEDYIKEDMTIGVGDGIYQVPENHYFMLGDNRNNSNDSRFWIKPYVPRENIQAKAFLKVFNGIEILDTDY